MWAMLKQSFEKSGLNDIDIHNSKTTKKIYQKLNITDKDKIRLMEHRKSREMHDRIDLAFNDINVLEIDEDTKNLLAMTDMPSDKEFLKLLKLPYKRMWIETSFDKSEYDIEVENIKGILITEGNFVSDSDGSLISNAFIIYYLCTDNDKIFIDEIKICFTEDFTIIYDDKKTLKFLKSFLVNLILFIENPEVEMVVRKRNEKNQMRRIRDGKMPLPDSRIVRLTGKIKEYVSSFASQTTRNTYSHSFTVRGHWRHFKNEGHFKRLYSMSQSELISEGYYYYNEIIIKRINPFKKGSGIMIDKKYKVQADNETLQHIKDENLFYKDIKPLEEPLREKRQRENQDV